ncbi:hypothetical protein [Actinocorallia longicatena]|uniref:Uncharacterized protein n=1 Tax=Actinocorallia longicatena TaxID=111803 RepID=A0ABP6Q924_9ACTN
MDDHPGTVTYLWTTATATVEAFDRTALPRFNHYARSSLIAGIDPALIRITFR